MQSLGELLCARLCIVFRLVLSSICSMIMRDAILNIYIQVPLNHHRAEEGTY